MKKENLVFDGVKFWIYNSSGLISNTEKEELSEILIKEGAHKCLSSIDNDSECAELNKVTHIISENVEFSQYNEAENSMISVVKPKWVSDCINAQRILPCRPYSPDPKHILAEVNLTVADLDNADAEAIYGYVQGLGGQWSEVLTRFTTHIVSFSLDNKICLKAKAKPSIKIVLPDWIENCIKFRRKIDEYPYLLNASNFPSPNFHKNSNASLLSSENEIDLLSKNQSSDLNFSQIFKSKKFYIDESLKLSHGLKVAAYKAIESAGGEVSTALLPSTILITAYRSGKNYQYSCKNDLIIGNWTWLFWMISHNKWASPYERLLHFPKPIIPIPGMQNFIIAITNYSGDSRAYLEQLIKASGATYTKTLSAQNTHLISSSPTGKKFEAAKEWQINIVNHLWLEESYAEFKLQSVANPRYVQFLPTSSEMVGMIGKTPLNKKVIIPTKTHISSSNKLNVVLENKKTKEKNLENEHGKEDQTETQKNIQIENQDESENKKENGNENEKEIEMQEEEEEEKEEENKGKNNDKDESKNENENDKETEMEKNDENVKETEMEKNDENESKEKKHDINNKKANESETDVEMQQQVMVTNNFNTNDSSNDNIQSNADYGASSPMIQSKTLDFKKHEEINSNENNITPNKKRGKSKSRITPTITPRSSRAAKEKASKLIHEDVIDMNQFKVQRKSNEFPRLPSEKLEAQERSIELEIKRRKKRSSEIKGDDLSKDVLSDPLYENESSPSSKQDNGRTPIVVLLTGCGDFTSAEKVTLHKYGIDITKNYKNIDFISCPKVLRTEKFLCAISQGPDILNSDYIRDVLSKKQFISPESYYLKDPEYEKMFENTVEDLVNMSKKIKKNGGIFRNIVLNVTPNVGGGLKAMKNIIEANGGRFNFIKTSRVRKFEACKSKYDNIIILIAGKNEEGFINIFKNNTKDFLNDNVYIYGFDWIISSVLSMKLTFDTKYSLKPK